MRDNQANFMHFILSGNLNVLNYYKIYCNFNRSNKHLLVIQSDCSRISLVLAIGSFTL